MEGNGIAIFVILAIIVGAVFIPDKIYKIKKLLKFLSDKQISTPADIVLILAPAYFLYVKKEFNFSITTYLMDLSVIKENELSWLVDYSVKSLYVIVFLSACIKVATIICEKWKILDRSAISPDGIKTVCLNINKEIEAHLAAIRTTERRKIFRELSTHHHFRHNIGLIVLALVEHLAESLKIEKKRKDVFISLYAVKDFENGWSLADFDQTNNNFVAAEGKVQKMEYLNHWDSTSTHKYSAQIDFGLEKYEKYECVKAYKSGKYVHTFVGSKDYYCDPNNPRPRTTKNFLCFFITIEDQVVGLLNIEFHNNKIFATEEEMIQYVQTDLMPFKYMVQYQFLKKRFLNALLPEEKR